MAQRCQLTRKSYDNLSSDRAKDVTKLNMARLLPVLSVFYGIYNSVKLRLSPFKQHGVPFTFIMTESNILMVNVPVASLQLFYQPAFGVSPVPQELRRTDIM